MTNPAARRESQIQRSFETLIYDVQAFEIVKPLGTVVVCKHLRGVSDCAPR